VILNNLCVTDPGITSICTKYEVYWN